MTFNYCYFLVGFGDSTTKKCLCVYGYNNGVFYFSGVHGTSAVAYQTPIGFNVSSNENATLGVLLDLQNNIFQCIYNGKLGNPLKFSSLDFDINIVLSSNNSTQVNYSVNFGQEDFKYGLPDGYESWDENVYHQVKYYTKPKNIYLNNIPEIILKTVNNKNNTELYSYTIKDITSDNILSGQKYNTTIDRFSNMANGINIYNIAINNNDKVIRNLKIEINKENLYRTKLNRTFLNTELGYKNKNINQNNKTEKRI